MKAARENKAIAAYERVFDVWRQAAPGAGRRARAALGILMDGLARSPEPDAFARSTLTMTGSPFEPAFLSAAPGVRYTVDPAPPRVGLLRRLDYSLALLERLGAPAPPEHLVRRLAPLQAKGELRYGAQIGGRHSESADCYKLYIELPPEAEAEADAFGKELLGSGPVLNTPGRNARPTLVGVELTSGRLEIYYRIENLHPLEIGTLMGRVNAAKRAPEVLATLAETQPLPIRHRLPGHTWGFSYSPNHDGSVTFSLYTFARTLFGPDGWVRAGLLSVGRSHGWDLTTYERMSEPLIGRRGAINHHGIFGLIAPPDQPVTAWIGMAPPESRV